MQICPPPGEEADTGRDKSAARRLAILRHAEEVAGNVALTCRYYGDHPAGLLPVVCLHLR
jgi:hypothetical protein